MAIITTPLGFEQAHLKMGNSTSINATKEGNIFRVSLGSISSYWVFNEEGCLEAAELFKQLANELLRQRTGKDTS